jgi:uncharacterized membrane protein YkoI
VAATPAARNEEDTMERNVRTIGWAAGLVTAGVLAGGVLASSMTASAQSPTATTGSTTAAAPRGQRAGETLLTGTDLATARAAALKAVPGATVVRVETDADGAVYEAHVTKADGTAATVTFDKSFTVTAVEAGMGGGGAPPAA